MSQKHYILGYYHGMSELWGSMECPKESRLLGEEGRYVIYKKIEGKNGIGFLSSTTRNKRKWTIPSKFWRK